MLVAYHLHSITLGPGLQNEKSLDKFCLVLYYSVYTQDLSKHSTERAQISYTCCKGREPDAGPTLRQYYLLQNDDLNKYLINYVI